MAFEAVLQKTKRQPRVEDETLVHISLGYNVLRGHTHIFKLGHGVHLTNLI